MLPNPFTFHHLIRGLSFVLIAQFTTTSANAQDWKARFETEAPAAWERYRQTNQYAQGVCHSELRGNDLPQPRETEMEWKINESCRSVKITNLATGSTEVFGHNPQYSFWLKGTKERGWILVSLLKSGQQPDGPSSMVALQLDGHREAIEAAVRLDPDGQLLGDIVQSSRTRITSVTAKSEGGVELVEVKFEYTAEPEAPRKLLGGFLLLDPARGWLPVSYTTRVKNKVGIGTCTTEFKYREGISSPPNRLMYRQEYQLSSQTAPWSQIGTSERELRVPSRLPDTREFTLTAYGLPEPVGVTWDKPIPRYIWFLAGAAIFGILAVGFRYLARRRSLVRSSTA